MHVQLKPAVGSGCSSEAASTFSRVATRINYGAPRSAGLCAIFLGSSARSGLQCVRSLLLARLLAGDAPAGRTAAVRSRDAGFTRPSWQKRRGEPPASCSGPDTTSPGVSGRFAGREGQGMVVTSLPWRN